MGHSTSACLTPPADRVVASPTITVDQAIFTSIPSPVGEGYRIVAASRDFPPEVRSEILRHCPSHGGMCSPAAGADGVIGFRLPDRSHAVGWCRHAGSEHTGRGGQRVHTHLIVLSGEDYRRLGANPLVMRRLMRQALGEEPLCKPPADLPTLTLPVSAQAMEGGGGATTRLGTPDDEAWLLHLVGCMLDEERLIVADAGNAEALLDWVLRGLPVSLRECLAVSVGVQFLPARQTRLAMIDGNTLDTERTIRGHRVALLKPSGPLPGRPTSKAQAWLELIGQWWRRGRQQDLARLTRKLVMELDGDGLSRLATMCLDLDGAGQVTSERGAELRGRYQGWNAANAVEAELLKSILDALPTLPPPKAPDDGQADEATTATPDPAPEQATGH